MAEETEENGKQNGQGRRQSKVTNQWHKLQKEISHVQLAIEHPTTYVELAANATGVAIVVPTLDAPTQRPVDYTCQTSSFHQAHKTGK